MIQYHVITKGSSISFGCNLSQQVIDAYSYTLTSAQEYAREINPDPWTSDYFDAMIKNMCSLGWSASALTDFTCTPNEREDVPVSIAAKELLSNIQQSCPFLITSAFDTSSYIQRFIHILKNAPGPLQSVLDEWWGNLKVEANVRKMEIAPLFSVLETPGTLMFRCSLSLKAASWRSLLDIQNTCSMQFSGKALTMMLNMPRYALEEKALKRRLVDKFESDIRIESIYL